jgi:transcriptional regulator with XRE-family HTH domain
MATITSQSIGVNIKTRRKAMGLTQLALASAARIPRLQIVRMEAGLVVPRLDEAVRIAEVLKACLEWLIAGDYSSRTGLRGIALELYQLGIRDLQVADPRVPGTFRHAEEVLVLAVSWDQPEPRVVEAIPYILARWKLRPSLIAGFANLHDPRARTRLAWLSDVTFALGRLSSAPLAIQTEGSLRALIRLGQKATEPDGLGHPSRGNVSPIWRRWNVTYAGTLQDFLRRTIEVDVAFQSSQTITGGEL